MHQRPITMRDIIRAAIIAALVFTLAQDLKDIIMGLSSASAVRNSMVDWLHWRGRSGHRNALNNKDLTESDSSGNDVNPLEDPQLEALRVKLRNAGLSIANGDWEAMKKLKFDDVESQQMQVLKTHLTNVMQEWCLPKLVCELHASVTERTSVSEAERSLLSLIKDTSIGTMGEVISKYHFAAHMGQLMSGMEGTGCHNLYPNCPLSGNRVLQMVKKVRVR